LHEVLDKMDVPKREYPECLKEKVTAIEDALKYFGIIE